MVTEKLGEGIRQFVADATGLEQFIEHQKAVAR